MNNQWTLWKYQPVKGYSSFWYFWIDPENIIRYARTIEPLGYMPIVLDVENWKDKKINLDQFKKSGVIRVRTKMTQEQLSEGQLQPY